MSIESTPSSPGYGTAAEEAWNSLDFLRVVLDKLWLIVLIAVAGFFVTYGYLAGQAPVYRATGSLEVEPPSSPSQQARSMVDDEPNLSTVEQLNTLVEDLIRPSFLLAVANDPTLQADPTLFPAKPDGSVYTDQQKIRVIGSCVQIALQKGTLLILVSATHPQPATAERVCEVLLETYVKERMENKSGSEQETYRFLLSEADRLGQALANEEREIQKYDQLEKYEEQITAQKTQLAALSQRYKAKYPAMIEEVSFLQTLQDAFDAEMQRIIKADQENGTQPVVTIDPAVGITDDLRARMIGRYQVLKRDIDTQRALFESLTAQKNQSDVMRSAQEETAVKIEDHPVLPETPVSQNPARALCLGTVVGAGLGVVLAILLNSMDRSLKSVEQAEALLELPVLTAVPEIQRRKNKAKLAPEILGTETEALPAAALAEQLPILADGNSPPAEAIRSLRAAMSLIGAEDERRSVIFTSALPSEGKSFTAANYSIALASQGLKTLLIDADLRRPSVHAIFGAARRTPGMVDYFLGREPLENFVLTTSVPFLDLLLSGTATPNPAELLAGRCFSRLMAEAMGRYDRLVIDTAPINPVSDTLLLVKQVQSVCLVVRAASSPGEAVLRAARMLDKAGKRPVGLVFNRVSRHAHLHEHLLYRYHREGDSYGNSYGPALT